MALRQGALSFVNSVAQSRRCVLVLLVLVFPIGIAYAQHSPADQDEIARRVERLMNIQVAFEQMVPSGMSIEAKEVSRKGVSGRNLIVQYHIFVKGAAPNALFQLLEWPPTAEKPSIKLQGISIGKDGILMCAGIKPEQCGDPRRTNDPIEFTVLPLKGEPSRFAFVAPDIKIGLVIVADPIESKDKGCTLNLVRLTRAFDLAFVSGTGYPPDTDVHYTVSSETSNARVVRSDGKGRLRVAVIPYPGNKKQGIATIKITEATCSPQASWEWGPLS